MCGPLVPWSLIGPQLDKHRVSREKGHSCRHIIILNSIWTGTKGDKIKKFSVEKQTFVAYKHSSAIIRQLSMRIFELIHHAFFPLHPFKHTYMWERFFMDWNMPVFMFGISILSRSLENIYNRFNVFRAKLWNYFIFFWLCLKVDASNSNMDKYFIVVIPRKLSLI